MITNKKNNKEIVKLENHKQVNEVKTKIENKMLTNQKNNRRKKQVINNKM